MDPNQQPNQQPQPVTPPPSAPPQPYQQAPMPQTPTSYGTAEPMSYDPNYLDTIAPAAPPPKFFSGSFGKIFAGMMVLFILAVSLIVAFSGKDQTADLQQIAVRLANLQNVERDGEIQENIKSNNLSTTNSNFVLWLKASTSQAEDLLAKGGVKKTQYNKTMVAKETKIKTDLLSKFEDARLNAQLDRVYARTMASETEKLLVMFGTMGKASKSKAIRDYATSTAAVLKPYHDQFDKYVDDGIN